MKIISWNVNWVRAVVKKWFKEFIENQKPDIFCLQETKAFEDQFLKEIESIKWYNYVWHSWKTKWYAGTAIFYREDMKILDTKNHFDEIEHFHSDGRITEIELEDFVLINWYYPNGWQKVTQVNMLDYKLEFYDHMLDYVKNLKKSGKNIILTWDFNICHKAIDIARPKENENSIWFLPVEREKIWELIDSQFIDVWRELNPEKTDVYSWWSYRAGARPRNVGWRIDYFMLDKDLTDKNYDMKYLTDVMWSDHCPLLLDIDI